jgi:hypothetical protein
MKQKISYQNTVILTEIINITNAGCVLTWMYLFYRNAYILRHLHSSFDVKSRSIVSVLQCVLWVSSSFRQGSFHELLFVQVARMAKGPYIKLIFHTLLSNFFQSPLQFSFVM